jgi:hypothetical protein
VVSSWQDVISGVHQGSVLGPVLFLVFINDWNSKLLNQITKFVDNQKIYSWVSNTVLGNQLQADLSELFDWSSTWKMSINIEKMKFCTMANLIHE